MRDTVRSWADSRASNNHFHHAVARQGDDASVTTAMRHRECPRFAAAARSATSACQCAGYWRGAVPCLVRARRDRNVGQDHEPRGAMNW